MWNEAHKESRTLTSWSLQFTSVFSDFTTQEISLGEPVRNVGLGNSLVVQWLGLSASTARVPGSIPGWGTKIP